jgi:hypothetical protein
MGIGGQSGGGGCGAFGLAAAVGGFGRVFFRYEVR